MNTLFAQLWKEYTLSDSRYLTLDVFTVCVEAITVVCAPTLLEMTLSMRRVPQYPDLTLRQKFAWGPLALLTLLAIIRDHPARHPSQIVICTAHLYGVALYYLTNWAEGVSYSRPEFLYYWVYYAGMNAPWVIVPLCKPPTSPLAQRYPGHRL